MYEQVLKQSWRNFENRNSGAVSDNDAPTSNAIAKWMAPLDSVHQIGLKTVLKAFLIVG